VLLEIFILTSLVAARGIVVRDAPRGGRSAMKPMRFGIRLIDDLGTPDRLVRLAELADELGFDGLLYPASPFRANAWALCAAVARSTHRIEINVGGPIHTTDPSEIATYAATLDHLAGGRVTLRMGAHNYDTLAWVGIDGSDVVARTREACDIVRRLLRGEKVEHAGAVYDWTKQAFLRFRPLRAEIPIWITPVGDELLELSGEIGDGSWPMVTPPASAAAILAPIERGLHRSAHPERPFERVAGVWLAVSENGVEARDLLADIVAYYGPFLDPRALAMIGLGRKDFAPAYALAQSGDRSGARALVTPLMLRTGIAGTPGECIRQLEVIADAGFDHVSIGGPLGPDPAEALRLIARKVMPAFR